MDDAHAKTHLLYQMHLCRLPAPVADYDTDRKSALDQSLRIIQAMLDVAAENGWLATALRVVRLAQMVVQARWHHDPPLSTLPHVEPRLAKLFRHRNIGETIPEVQFAANRDRDLLLRTFTGILKPEQISEMGNVLRQMPVLRVSMALRGWWAGDVGERKAPLPLRYDDIKMNDDSDWLVIHADQNYLLSVELEQLNRRDDRRSFAPRFPKRKDEGWIVVVGDEQSQELLALKRVAPAPNRRRTTANLQFTTPAHVGKCLYSVYVLSDCYLGLDQQYRIALDVAPRSLEALVNSEVDND